MTVRFESQAEPIPGYRLLERLGSGGFGEVWKCEAPGGIFKAVKVVFGDIRSQDADTARFAEQELKALKRVKQVRHPYLLALDRYDIVDGRLMIVMELADCNLWDKFRDCRKKGLQGIPRDDLLRYMEEAAEALDLMNDEFQLQHLDIKPQNLFLVYNHVKVADFGQVKDLQGMAAQVTGGITPVYAAPETFDGFISRFCDQYSLACVYQELLTGQRPFDGSSMQQLLMQHLQMPPNLGPSPSSDRPALRRALAKKPDDRFPSCRAMVAALRAGNAGTATQVAHAEPPSVAAPPPAARVEPPPAPPPSVPPPATSGPGSYPTARPAPPTPPPDDLADTFPPATAVAPPEVTGPGCLRPAVVIGVGFAGLRVIQRFRQAVEDRFGPPERVPVVRTLYVDTDPDALTAATAADPPPGLARLRPEDVFAAKLNRSAHYLKPRFSGRNLLEEWFDAQLLYKIPRNPATLGLRVFGRLALLDHYRPLMAKLDGELAAALDPAALEAARRATGLDVWTNRPRVYVAAGLGGGTGGGMLIDLAYCARARLKRLGYADPDVVGLLLVPPDGDQHTQTLANTYAALTELHHYGRPDTLFEAVYDDRPGRLRDTAPPFARAYLLPGLPGGLAPPPPAAGGGSGAVGMAGTVRSGAGSNPAVRMSGAVPNPRASGAWANPRASGPVPPPAPRPIDAPPADQDPCALAAEVARLELFTAAGRAVVAVAPPADPERAAGQVRAAGAVRFGWPRGEVVGKTGQLLAHALVHHWVAANEANAAGPVADWAAARWAVAGLDPEPLTAHFRQVADAAAGGPLDAALTALAEPLVPRGWLTRLPEPERVSATVEHVRRLIGRPSGPSAAGTQTAVELALAAAADQAADHAVGVLSGELIGLVDEPGFRPVGAEDAVRQLLAALDGTADGYVRRVAELERAGGAAYDLLVGYMHHQRGMRKPAAAEFTDALRTYPQAQHQAIVLRAVVHVYKRVREAAANLLNEVAGCRHRVETLLPALAPDSGRKPAPPAARDLLPPGCRSVADAARRFLDVLTDDDLAALDRRVQAAVTATFGGLYQVCLNPTDGLAGLLRLIQEETRAYLEERLGEVDLAGMLWEKCGGPPGAARELARGLDDAAPWVGRGPWARDEVTVFACPVGAGGDPVREAALHILPDAAQVVDARDEAVFYREYPGVPLAVLPQLGPAWSTAYRAAFEFQQVTAHSRLDVTKWVDVDSV